jgi:hypothetical protein
MSFTRVSKSHPCPVCKRPDWCRVFADGWAECMRIQSDQPAKSGGWMHKPNSTAGGYARPWVPPVMLPPPPAIDALGMIDAWRLATLSGALEGLAASLGVSLPSLVAVSAAWAPPHSAWAFPMCDGFGRVVGIRLRNERGKFAVRGSRQGIFLASVPAQKTLFVCEGPTDTAAAVELGLFAVGRPNCCCGGAEIKVFARRHGVSRVVVISDNDKPGLDGASKVGGELQLPFAIYVPPAKDLREFLRLGGTRLMIENTLKGLVWQSG